VLKTLLLVAAFILFVIAAWLGKSLQAAGLACWVLTEVIPRLN
jgi:hypothetical protein